MTTRNRFGEDRILNAQTRAALQAEGLAYDFIDLPGGVTHYQYAALAPADGESAAAPTPVDGESAAAPVVLVHGFSTPLMLWDHTFDALVEAGLPVLRFDLYGRGCSDRPEGPYTADLFVAQLVALLDALAIAGPVNIVGCSMGGLIAVHACDRHPARFGKLVLVDAVGFPVIKPSLAALLLFVPGIGDALMMLRGDKVMLDGLPRDFYNPEPFFPAYAEQYARQMRYQGFKRAVLNTMRRMPFNQGAEVYARVGAQGRAVQVIWGRHDQTVPVEATALIQEAMPQAEVHVIEQAGHTPHYERPAEVNPLLVAFLKRA